MPTTVKTRILVDLQDQSQDYFLPESRAKELFEAGLLFDPPEPQSALPWFYDPTGSQRPGAVLGGKRKRGARK